MTTARREGSTDAHAAPMAPDQRPRPGAPEGAQAQDRPRLSALQTAAARLLTDNAYRRRVFPGLVGQEDGRGAGHVAIGAQAARAETSGATGAGASDSGAAELGLTATELAIVRRLDPRLLDVVSEGYQGKRIEPLVSAFPRCLAVVDAQISDGRRRYLETTPFPPDDEAERRQFLAWLRDAHAEGDLRRRLQDLAALEMALLRLRAAPGPTVDARQASVGGPVPATIGPLARSAAVVQTRGDLAAALAAPPAARLHYAESPAQFVVLRDGDAVACERLDGEVAALWSACDGQRTAADLTAFTSAAPTHLARWRRGGALLG